MSVSLTTSNMYKVDFVFLDGKRVEFKFDFEWHRAKIAYNPQQKQEVDGGKMVIICMNDRKTWNEWMNGVY